MGNQICGSHPESRKALGDRKNPWGPTNVNWEVTARWRARVHRPGNTSVHITVILGGIRNHQQVSEGTARVSHWTVCLPIRFVLVWDSVENNVSPSPFVPHGTVVQGHYVSVEVTVDHEWLSFHRRAQGSYVSSIGSLVVTATLRGVRRSMNESVITAAKLKSWVRP